MEIEKVYEPQRFEPHWAARWVDEQLFSVQAGDGPRFSLAIPPPNVTGSLHIGHMIGHTEMDMIIRYHRMIGDNTLWIPGTDHAGIATQMVVERKLAQTAFARTAAYDAAVSNWFADQLAADGEKDPPRRRSFSFRQPLPNGAKDRRGLRKVTAERITNRSRFPEKHAAVPEVPTVAYVRLGRREVRLLDESFDGQPASTRRLVRTDVAVARRRFGRLDADGDNHLPAAREIKRIAEHLLEQYGFRHHCRRIRLHRCK